MQRTPNLHHKTLMKLPAGEFIVEFTQPKSAGIAWVVRVYKKHLLFKKLISSDWFLDEEQAWKFAEKLAADLRSRDVSAYLKERKPGWMLYQPPR